MSIDDGYSLQNIPRIVQEISSSMGTQSWHNASVANDEAHPPVATRNNKGRKPLIGLLSRFTASKTTPDNVARSGVRTRKGKKQTHNPRWANCLYRLNANKWRSVELRSGTHTGVQTKAAGPSPQNLS